MSNVNDFVIENGVLIKYNGSGGDVVVPDGVAAIGSWVFSGCRSLKSITLPEGVTSIGDWAFYGNKSITSITLPNSVKSIGDRTFCGCEGLADEEGFVIVRNVLYDYYGPGGDIVISDGVTSIGKEAFWNCESLESITIPNSVTNIGDSAFRNCENLTSVALPDGLEAVGYSAFSDCASLTSITLPNSVTDIDVNAFDAKALRMLVAPKIPVELLKKAKLMFVAMLGFFAHRELFDDADIVKEYEKYAFQQKKKILPEIFKADDINALAFYERNGKINIANFETDYLTPAQEAKATQCIAYLLDWQSKNISAQQREAHLEKELNKDPFSEKEMKKLWSFEALKNGTWCITGYKGEELNIVIPQKIGTKIVTAIGDDAFSSRKFRRLEKQCKIMRRLESITIPDSVKSIGNSAFYACTSLASIKIPDGVKSIEERMFADCKCLASITLPDSVKCVRQMAFYGCEKLTIHAPVGSWAEAYAREKKIPFIAE